MIHHGDCLEVLRIKPLLEAVQRAEEMLDRMVTKGRLESGVVTIDEDDFDAWFIRDELAKARAAYEGGERV